MFFVDPVHTCDVAACVHHILCVACYRVLCFLVFHICEGGGACGDNICVHGGACVPPHI